MKKWHIRVLAAVAAVTVVASQLGVIPPVVGPLVQAAVGPLVGAPATSAS